MTYVYNAAMWCDACAERTMWDLNEAGAIDTGDSNDYPQADTSDRTADTPQHCDSCHVFLENPLTADGWDYIRETITADVAAGRYESVACTEWAPFYGYPWRDEGDA